MRLAPLWLCLASLPTFAAGVLVDRIVAVVDTKAITRSDVETRVRVAAQLAREKADVAELRRAALEELIEEALISHDADRLKLEVTDAEVDLALNRIAETNAITLEQLSTEAKAQGLEMRGYRAMLKRKILEMKWVNLRADTESLSKAADPGEFLLGEKRRLVAQLRAAAAVEVRP